MTRHPALEYRAKDYSATRRWLPLIVGLAVGIRFALALIHPFIFPDSRDYDALGQAIAAHQGYQVGGNIATRMPGYPIFIALFYVVHWGLHGVLIAQAFMSGGIVIFTYLLGARIRQSIGLLAALFIAVDPLSVAFSAALLTETPFTLCLMASLWLCLRIAAEPRTRSLWILWVALGVVWGIAVYFRASALWCILPLVLWCICAMKGQPIFDRLFMPAVALVLLFAILSPWLARNYRHFHSGPLRLTTLEGISFYEAVYDDADGGPRQHLIALPPTMQNMDESQRNDEWSRQAWKFIRDDPARIVELGLVKIARTWSPRMNAAEFQSGPIQWLLTLWYVPLFLLALLGILLGLNFRLAGLLFIPLAYFTAVHALFIGSVRYRVPLMPVVCLLAAAGLIWLVNKAFKAKPSPRQPVF